MIVRKKTEQQDGTRASKDTLATQNE